MLQIKTLRNPLYLSFSQLLLCPEVVMFLFTGIKLNLRRISAGVERVSYNRSLKNIHLSASNQISNTAQIQNKTLTERLSVGVLFCIFLLYRAQTATSPSETVKPKLPPARPSQGLWFLLQKTRHCRSSAVATSGTDVLASRGCAAKFHIPTGVQTDYRSNSYHLPPPPSSNNRKGYSRLQGTLSKKKHR